jgi:DNA-binding MarR family transcriptional regulator
VTLPNRCSLTTLMRMAKHRRSALPADHVARLMESWRRERPDLDVEPLAIVYRTTRLAAHLAAEVEKPFRDSGITSADFAVLANLRRVGTPYQLSQRQLMEVLSLTSGTISVRIDRLVRAGLVTRQPDPDDGRGVRVTLSDDGAELFDALAPQHLGNEARLVAALDPDQRADLARLLHILLVEFEAADPRPGDALGMRVAAAHLTQERRAGVGLPAEPDLLVQGVRPSGPAAIAGIQPGDLLTGTDSAPLRSLSCLAAATHGRRRVTITYRRGSAEHTATIQFPPPDDP